MNKNISITKPIFKIILVTIAFVTLTLAPGTTYFYFAKDYSIAESIFFSLIYSSIWVASIIAFIWCVMVISIAINTKLKEKRNREQETREES